MPVFLDHAATTPCRPVALQALNSALEQLGNPSSVHGHGQNTRAILEDARDQVAHAVGANRSEILGRHRGKQPGHQGHLLGSKPQEQGPQGHCYRSQRAPRTA
ncbi:MAG: aminotransferase class V-fold PLP-dependent enzyme [Actinobacteria bacterium]|nr:aminotransferase class V-fold PLP-dependent enzyme [Actinomycetota bacterium]